MIKTQFQQKKDKEIADRAKQSPKRKPQPKSQSETTTVTSHRAKPKKGHVKAARGTRMKTSYSELDSGDRTASRAYMRNLYLPAIAKHGEDAEHEKDALGELRGEPLRIYRENQRVCRRIDLYKSIRASRELPPPVKALVESVNAWARKYRLDDDWFLEVAYYSLYMWTDPVTDSTDSQGFFNPRGFEALDANYQRSLVKTLKGAKTKGASSV